MYSPYNGFLSRPLPSSRDDGGSAGAAQGGAPPAPGSVGHDSGSRGSRSSSSVTEKAIGWCGGGVVVGKLARTRRMTRLTERNDHTTVRRSNVREVHWRSRLRSTEKQKNAALIRPSSVQNGRINHVCQLSRGLPLTGGLPLTAPPLTECQKRPVLTRQARGSTVSLGAPPLRPTLPVDWPSPTVVPLGLTRRSRSDPTPSSPSPSSRRPRPWCVHAIYHPCHPSNRGST